MDGAVTGAEYLNMLKSSIVPAIHQKYSIEEVYIQKDRAPPHYHHKVRAYVDAQFPKPLDWVKRMC